MEYVSINKDDGKDKQTLNEATIATIDDFEDFIKSIELRVDANRQYVNDIDLDEFERFLQDSDQTTEENLSEELEFNGDKNVESLEGDADSNMNVEEKINLCDDVNVEKAAVLVTNMFDDSDKCQINDTINILSTSEQADSTVNGESEKDIETFNKDTQVEETLENNTGNAKITSNLRNFRKVQHMSLVDKEIEILYDKCGWNVITENKKDLTTNAVLSSDVVTPDGEPMNNLDNGVLQPTVNIDNEVIDIISITSSEENDTSPKEDIKLKDEDSDYCEGYHSSDFEFITESEAEMDGLIINYAGKKLDEPKTINKPHTYTVEISKDVNYQSGSSQDLDIDKAGPTHVNNDYNLVYIEPDYRKEHKIPEGDDYLNLFRGFYAPAFADLFLLENKSIRPLTSMNMQYDGVGFEVPCRGDDQTDPATKKEADATAQIIHEMYPTENTRRKLRRRF